MEPTPDASARAPGLPERLTVKLYLDGGPATGVVRGLAKDLAKDLIHVFGAWIRDHAVGELLLDVHDYSHLARGPGVMLVAHEGHYRFDDSDGRPGLQYARKRQLGGDWPARLRTVLREALTAAIALERAERLAGKVRFAAGEWSLRIDDRLRAPNDEATFTALRPHLQRFGRELFGGEPGIERVEGDPRAPFMVRMVDPASRGLQELLERLGPR